MSIGYLVGAPILPGLGLQLSSLAKKHQVAISQLTRKSASMADTAGGGNSESGCVCRQRVAGVRFEDWRCLLFPR
jgi:hypothetical protein